MTAEREQLLARLREVQEHPETPEWPVDEEETVWFSSRLMLDHLRRELAALD